MPCQIRRSLSFLIETRLDTLRQKRRGQRPHPLRPAFHITLLRTVLMSTGDCRNGRGTRRPDKARAEADRSPPRPGSRSEALQLRISEVTPGPRNNVIEPAGCPLKHRSSLCSRQGKASGMGEKDYPQSLSGWQLHSLLPTYLGPHGLVASVAERKALSPRPWPRQETSSAVGDPLYVLALHTIHTFVSSICCFAPTGATREFDCSRRSSVSGTSFTSCCWPLQISRLKPALPSIPLTCHVRAVFEAVDKTEQASNRRNEGTTHYTASQLLAPDLSTNFELDLIPSTVCAKAFSMFLYRSRLFQNAATSSALLSVTNPAPDTRTIFWKSIIEVAPIIS